MSELIKNSTDYVIDAPSDNDYLFDEYLQEESADGLETKRPKKLIKVFNQKQSLKCTWYALQHICNGININQDLNNIGEVVREQVDPATREDNQAHYLTTRLTQFKNEGLIKGYLSIPKVGRATPTGLMTKERRANEMRIALEKGFYIYTGTEFVSWTMVQSQNIKFSTAKKGGHAFGIVENNGDFIMINSFGEGWGDNGYGYIKESDVDKLFTCYVIIPNENTEFFDKFKANRKVMQFIQKAKELYNEGNSEVKKYFEQIQLTKTLLKLYKM